MSPREIDAAVAERFMGWTWWVNQERRMRLIVGPEPWVRWNWNKKIMVPWNGDLDVIPFSDWDRACALRHPDNPERLVQQGLPYYSTDPVASKQLRDHMAANGWMYTVRWRKDMYSAEFYKYDDDECFSARHVKEELTVAIAALAVFGIEVEP